MFFTQDKVPEVNKWIIIYNLNCSAELFYYTGKTRKPWTIWCNWGCRYDQNEYFGQWDYANESIIKKI